MKSRSHPRAGAERPLLQPGQALDRYVVEELVSSSETAELYRVRHVWLGSLHAMKVLRIHSNVHFRRALLREGKAQALLLHPNLVRVTDAFDVRARPALVMDWVDGPSLADVMEAHGAMELQPALELFTGVVSGMAYAHAHRIIHRDLKPENVLVAGAKIPRVADFGLLKMLDPHETEDSGLSAYYSFLGTPEYMAPEQMGNPAGVDYRADLWSLGCILYELVTGHVAFEAEDTAEAMHLVVHGLYEPPESRRPELPASLVRIIKQLLLVDAAKRTESCSMLLNQLAEVR